MSDITLNEWEQLEYHDPKHVLLEFRKIEQFIADKTIDKKVRTMRTPKLRRHREGREGALFTYGLQAALLGIPIRFALAEANEAKGVKSSNVKWCFNYPKCEEANCQMKT